MSLVPTKRRETLKAIVSKLSDRGVSATAGMIQEILQRQGVDVSEYTIRGDLKALGLTKGKGKGNRYTDADNALIIETVKGGGSQADLSEALGRTPASFYAHVRGLRAKKLLPESEKSKHRRAMATALESFDYDFDLDFETDENEDNILPPAEEV